MSQSSAPTSDLAVSVVICAYTDRRWALLCEAIQSVRRQRRAAAEIVLVIDHSPQLADRARAEFPDVRVIANEQARGLSGARNTGVLRSSGDIVAFLDDDATAAADWLQELVEVFLRPDVMGAGGIAAAAWDGAAPAWLPPEFLWVVGASYVGLPLEPTPIRNPIGANMAFRRIAFELAGGFTDGIGRIGKTPLGCEETEFSIRLASRAPGSVIMHVPQARVEHHIAAERATLRYFVTRCWAEGLSKALVTAAVGGAEGLSSERAYVSRVLPLGVLAGIRTAARGDIAGLARATAIFVGGAVTFAGFVRGRAARRPPRSSSAAESAQRRKQAP